MDNWKARILLWKLQHEKDEADKQGDLFPPDEKKKIEDSNRATKRKLEELQRNARKKIERKPIVDDDGDPIPF